MDKATSATICRLIAGIVVADDDLRPAEEAFLDRVLAQFDIAERDTIFPIVDRSEAAATLRTLPEATRADVLALLIDAATADQVVAPEELAFLNAIASEIGVSGVELDRKIAARLGAP